MISIEVAAHQAVWFAIQPFPKLIKLHSLQYLLRSVLVECMNSAKNCKVFLHMANELHVSSIWRVTFMGQSYLFYIARVIFKV